MKPILLIWSIYISSAICFAHESSPERPDYQIHKSIFDSSLSSNEAVFDFKVNGLNALQTLVSIAYSINDKVDTILLNLNRDFVLHVQPGKYSFAFFYTSNYREIFIKNIQINNQHRTTISLNFKSNSKQNMQVKKPVIYLYPDQPALVEVKIKPEGDLTFTYPAYDQSWKVLADPSGELKTEDSKTYNYLFWEAEQSFHLNEFDFSQGSIVNRANTILFLENKLTQFGLNSKEQADFITFWGPQLMQNENNFIHFVTNEAADLFADLEIVPAPNAIYRIYLIYTDPKNLDYTTLSEQILPVMNRNGFIALEWGGAEVHPFSEF